MLITWYFRKNMTMGYGVEVITLNYINWSPILKLWISDGLDTLRIPDNDHKNILTMSNPEGTEPKDLSVAKMEGTRKGWRQLFEQVKVHRGLSRPIWCWWRTDGVSHHVDFDANKMISSDCHIGIFLINEMANVQIWLDSLAINSCSLESRLLTWDSRGIRILWWKSPSHIWSGRTKDNANRQTELSWEQRCITLPNALYYLRVDSKWFQSHSSCHPERKCGGRGTEGENDPLSATEDQAR